MRHVIIEGPDGSGKSRLVRFFNEKLGFPLHPRASTSKEGPVKNLAAWVTSDVRSWRLALTPTVYDRHPVMSEYIYGPLCRGKAQPGFTDSPWLSAQRLLLYENALVIWCLPPLSAVQVHVSKDRDMPGVAENIEAIHKAYVEMARSWGGLAVVYDFTLQTHEEFHDSILHNLEEDVYASR